MARATVFVKRKSKTNFKNLDEKATKKITIMVKKAQLSSPHRYIRNETNHLFLPSIPTFSFERSCDDKSEPLR